MRKNGIQTIFSPSLILSVNHLSNREALNLIRRYVLSYDDVVIRFKRAPGAVNTYLITNTRIEVVKNFNLSKFNCKASARPSPIHMSCLNLSIGGVE